jgi:hypothetical protein
MARATAVPPKSQIITSTLLSFFMRAIYDPYFSVQPI